MDSRETRQAYWAANLRLLAVLLAIWAFCSYGLGIVFADALNQIRLPGTGFKLGFWFAQQGSIYTFVILIWVYVRYMNKLDSDYRQSAVSSDAGDESSPNS